MAEPEAPRPSRSPFAAVQEGLAAAAGAAADVVRGTSTALVPVPGGTGSTEMAFTALYSWTAPASVAAGEHGLVAALGHRMAMLLVATTGGLICIFRWSALTDALAQARNSTPLETPAWSPSEA